jgi:hypothetical protein
MPTPELLFAAEDLTTPLGRTVSTAQAKHAERIVWGWLKGPLGLQERPDTDERDDVWAWAVELASIYIENPSGLSAEQLGPGQRQFSAQRRAEILEDASRASSTDGGVDALEPTGDFPPPPRYPDPATW